MQLINDEMGLDANEKTSGRKRSIVVDRLGLPRALAVTTVSSSDN